MIILNIMIPLLIVFQSGPDQYDNIIDCSYYVIRTDSIASSKSKVNACEIGNPKIAESIFGKCSYTSSYNDILFDENLTILKYNDGLDLRISDDIKRLFTFNITSDKYSLVLENEKILTIGMTLDEFKTIFPKSYAKRSIIQNQTRQQGNIQTVVYFYFTQNDEILFGGSWIIFVFGKTNGKLEQFQSFVPG